MLSSCVVISLSILELSNGLVWCVVRVRLNVMTKHYGIICAISGLILIVLEYVNKICYRQLSEASEDFNWHYPSPVCSFTPNWFPPKVVP